MQAQLAHLQSDPSLHFSASRLSYVDTYPSATHPAFVQRDINLTGPDQSAPSMEPQPALIQYFNETLSTKGGTLKGEARECAEQNIQGCGGITSMADDDQPNLKFVHDLHQSPKYRILTRKEEALVFLNSDEVDGISEGICFR